MKKSITSPFIKIPIPSQGNHLPNHVANTYPELKGDRVSIPSRGNHLPNTISGKPLFTRLKSAFCVGKLFLPSYQASSDSKSPANLIFSRVVAKLESFASSIYEYSLEFYTCQSSKYS